MRRHSGTLWSCGLALTLLATPTLVIAEQWRWYDGAGGSHLASNQAAIPGEFRSNADRLPPTRADPATALPRTLTRRIPSGPGPKSARRGADSERVDRNGNGEKYWRGRVAEVKGKIAATEAQIVNLRNRRRKEPLIRKERQRRSDLVAAEKELADLRRQLSVGLPEEARAAGASSRWLE